MLRIAHHAAYIHPLREGHRFPMLKYELIPAQLLHEGVVSSANFFAPELAQHADVLLAHDGHYVQALLDLTLDARMVRRIGFPLSKELIDREFYLAEGTIRSSVYALEYGVAFNTAGGTHHAGRDFGEGFCLLNDQAVAAAYLVDRKLAERILIVDLDVHQGNGTAHIFTGNQQIFTFSMHGEKNFPFIKEQSDLDVPLDDGLDDNAYLTLLDQHLAPVFDRVRPDFVFYQAGVDVLATDKLGKLKLSEEGCRLRDERVFQICRRRGIPVQVSMGGGYSTHIKDIVNAHVNTFKAAIQIFDL
ncbi:histone deacetylase family protein [Sphingobacterium paludis]|uniref:Acetoin utilization deacetylase AcuC-like enzyme n=1 Tax=Sphingobacterium paludis TaxID=1476465 RepID=A0A4R7CQX0_9SPHI|nr:histone deacetylase [Sphingobacterium paludis]TDS07578.1 acetoin utilization deacetylase AcuC-like enzyme [Sphingobacterium paludis]